MLNDTEPPSSAIRRWRASAIKHPLLLGLLILLLPAAAILLSHYEHKLDVQKLIRLNGQPRQHDVPETLSSRSYLGAAVPLADIKFYANTLDDQEDIEDIENCPMLGSRLDVVTSKWQELRKLYGALHCQVHGVGPTGGFCLALDSQGVGGNQIVDVGLCGFLVEAVGSNASVGDFGAGMGQYGKCLQEAGTGIQWSGFDGAENIEIVTKGAVQFLDLTGRKWVSRQFDWVVSLEVGEHIPKRFESIYLANLVRHAKRNILTSWAVPGQGGHHHVNEQGNGYIISEMQKLGFDFDANASRAARERATVSWFKKTLMVYSRRAD